MNQAIFEQLLIDDSEEVAGTLAQPFDLLIEASGPDGPENPRNATRPGVRAS